MHGRWARAFAFVALVCLGPSLGADTLQVRDDAYLTVGSGGPNRGHSHRILVGRFHEDADEDAALLSRRRDRGGTRVGLIRFDLSGLATAVTLERATLRLWVSRVHRAGSLEISPVLEGWGERSVTGANAPALGPSMGSLSVREQDEREFLTADVTSLVLAWLDHPESEHGLALVPASGSPLSVEFDSKENTLTSHPAELKLTLATGGIPGPPGPPGPTGPAGPPLASLNALEGVACSVSGAPGTVQLSYSPGGVVTLTCVVSQACSDADLDGFFAQAGCGTPVDCDDANPAVHPGAAEACGDQLDNNCSGLADEGCGGVGTYVAASIGNDANPGTQAAPFKTIGKGIATAVGLGGAQVVRVAQGEYPEKVTLVEGISLLGGHQCSAQACTWVREPRLYDTAIVNQDFEGVLAPDTITRNTRLDGFRVVGLSGSPPAAPGSVGISLKGGTPILQANRILGGEVIGGAGLAAQSVGIAVLAPSGAQGALVEANEVTGGPSIDKTSAILFDAAFAFPASPAVGLIVNNAIRGGAGLHSYGIAAWTAGPGTLVRGNDILAGSSTGEAWGIVVGSTMTIDANRINVDQASVGGCSLSSAAWCGGIASFGATAVITNNVVFGVKAARSAAVLLAELESPAGPVVLNANYLDGSGSGVTSTPGISTAVAMHIGTCNTCGFSGVIGRIRNNILAGGQNLFRYGIYEDMVPTRTAHPQALDNNDFHFAAAPGRTDVLYHFWDGAIATDINTLVLIPINPPPSGNFTGAPALDATFHLTTGSPCIDAGTSNEAPPADFEGDSRPQGVAIDVGPDEKVL